jgi:Iap family predicted aminopeptidase
LRTIFLFSLAAQLIAMGQSLSVSVVEDDVVAARLKHIEKDNNERRRTLEALFQETGCVEPALTSHKVRSAGSPNLICELKGESGQPIILVSAHFDKVRAGAGAIDNWSGASMLASLYQALANGKKIKHTFLFIAFTDEEKGLVGSRAWVKDHKKTLLKDVRAVVNIDSVGAGPLYVWHSQANPELEQHALRVSQALKFPLSGMSLDKVGQSDSLPFRDNKVPTIDFHSLDNETIQILHTIDDQLSAMKLDDYKSTYRFLAFYLTFLDQSLGPKAPGAKR